MSGATTYEEALRLAIDDLTNRYGTDDPYAWNAGELEQTIQTYLGGVQTDQTQPISEPSTLANWWESVQPSTEPVSFNGYGPSLPESYTAPLEFNGSTMPLPSGTPLLDYLSQYSNNTSADTGGLLSSLGIGDFGGSDWQAPTVYGGDATIGDPGTLWTLSPELQQKYADYTVSPTAQQGLDTTYTAYDPQGAQVGATTLQGTEDSWLDTLGYNGAFVALPALAGMAGLLPGVEGLLGAEAASAVTPEMLAAANAAADPIAALNAAAGWTGVDAAYLAGAGALAGSTISPEMIAAANATTDPIAALNASAGWTGVDPAYLSSISAPVVQPWTEPTIPEAGEIYTPPDQTIEITGQKLPPQPAVNPYVPPIVSPVPDPFEVDGAQAGPTVNGTVPPWVEPTIPEGGDIGQPWVEPTIPAPEPTLLDTLKTAGTGAYDFFKENKWALPLLGSGLSALGGGGSSSGGYVDSGYRPTITRNPSTAPTPNYMPLTPVGLLGQQYGSLNTPQQGNADSGLWRYLLRGK